MKARKNPLFLLCFLLTFLFVGTSLQLAHADSNNPLPGDVWWEGSTLNCYGPCKVADISSALDGKKDNLVELKLTGFEFENNAVCDSLFANCSNLQTVSGSGIAVDSIYTANYIFANCPKLEQVNMYSAQNPPQRTYLKQFSHAFEGDVSLKQVGPSAKLDLSYCDDMSYCFSGCTSLQSVNLVRATPEVIPGITLTAQSMFEGCSKLTTITSSESGFNVSHINNLQNMFKNCSSLFDLHLVRVAPVYTTVPPACMLDSIFEGCTSIEELSLEQFNNEGVTSVNSAFKGCSNLSILNIRGWLGSQSFTDIAAFDGCDDLHDVILSSSYVPTEASEFPFESSWFAQASAVKDPNPLTGRDAFVAYQSQHPNTSIEYWLAIFITYDANGGTFIDDTTSRKIPKEYDEQVTYVTAAQLTRTGYAFLGWADTASATTPTLDPDNLPQAINSPTTYYAVWQQNQVTVDFNAGQGSFADGTKEWSTTGSASSTLALPPVNPVLAYYDFAGWASTPGASTPEIIPGEPDTVPLYKNASEHYYAVWRVDNTVLFSGNGGIFPGGSVSMTTQGAAADTLKLPANEPTLDGYSFVGWATTASAQVPDMPTPLPTYANASPTYYAVWQENTKTVTFQGNGGSWGSETSKTTTGTLSSILSLPESPTRTGYDFIGYAEAQGATTPDIVPTDTKTYPTYRTATGVYYAIWVADTTVVFNANGGTFPSTGEYTWSESGALATQISLPEQPLRTYFTFLGWADSRDATEPNMPDPLPTYDAAEGMYYAVWKPATDTVTFYANGGKFADGQDSAATQGPSTSLIVLPVAPTWQDHVFIGWSATQGALSPDIVPSDSSTYPEYRSAKEQYYAVWTSSTSVVFDANGGLFAGGARIRVVDGPADMVISLPQDPERADQDFLGWSDIKSAREPNMPSPLPTFGSASRIYYAVWKHLPGHWVQDDNGWRYMDDDGEYVADEWKTIDGISYYFKPDSYMADNGWLKIDDKTFYFFSDGTHAVGWTEIDGVWYYFGDDGSTPSGWTKIADQWYFITQDGRIATGWLEQGGQTYYLGSDGVMQSGWQWIVDNWYYFASTGEMAHYAWLWIDTAWYYFDAAGHMLHWGWAWIDNMWYYLTSSGAMLTGWQWIDVAWYYLGYSGNMHEGWVWDNGWYYLNYVSGAMASNRWIGPYYVNWSGLWVR